MKIYEVNEWDIEHFKTLSHLNNDPTKHLIHNRMGRLYWVWKGDSLYEQRFARENGPYQVRNIKFLRHIYSKAKRVIDIGMNVANNTMEYATWCDEVVGFEPFPSTYELAVENINLNQHVKLQGRYYDSRTLATIHDLNSYDGWWKTSKTSFASLDIVGKDNIITHNIGLGSTPKKMPMAERPNNAGHNHIVIEGMKNKYQTTEVEIKTLDSFNYDHVDFIKIDCEGYEFEIIKGSNNTISAYRPTVQIEIVEAQCNKFGYKPQDLYDYFTKKDYLIYDFNGNNLGKEWNKPKGIMDFFFVPKELKNKVMIGQKVHPGMITGFGKKTETTFNNIFEEVSN